MGENIRSSLVWKKYEPKRREKLLDKYKGRFVVILSPAKKILYLSDMVVAKLAKPDYISLRMHDTLIGIAVSNKSEGFKVKYETTPCVNVETFVKDNPFEPGVYEARVEVMDAQTVDHFNMVIFDTSDHPSKTKIDD